MKKTLLVTILALTLVACKQKETIDKKVTENVNQEEIAENSQINEENNNQKDEKSEENQEIKRTYPKETTEKEVISVEKSTEKVKEENEKETHDKKDKKDEKSKKKDEKNPDKDSKKDGEKSDKSDKKSEKGLTEDDFFFSYYYLVTIRGGEICNGLTDIKDYSENYYVDYVPFSNNIFVLGSYDDHDFSIRKINGEDLTLLYDFKDNEDFRPKGMIGDKIYGIYHDNSEDTDGTEKNESGLAYVDLATGKINIFEDTKYKNEIVDQVAVTEKEVFFTKFNRDQSTDLYRLDLEKGLDQKAELVEKDTDISFLLSAKHFENGKAKYEIFKSSDGKIKINDIEYNIKDGTRFIGENIITSSPIKFDDVNYLFKIDVINYITGEVVEKDLETYGYRVANGKFYYIDYDKKIKTLDIGL